MKKLSYFLSAIALIAFTSCGQSATETTDESSDQEVMESEASDEEEDMDEEIGYEERHISIDALPEAVLKAFNTGYAGVTVKEVEELTDAEGVISYEIEIEVDGQEIDLMYSANGDLTEVENESAGDGDDEEDDE